MASSPNVVTYHHEVTCISFGEVGPGKLLGFTLGGPIDELRRFTKSSEIGQG